MSTQRDMPSSIVGAQVQRLLELVNDYQQTQCRALLDQAREQSRQIVQQARQNGRMRLHHEIQDARQQIRREISAARAKQHTLKMQQRHRSDREFLDQCWEILHVKLTQRWRDSTQRRLWTEKVLGEALTFLPGPVWRVDHPPQWPEAERKVFREKAANGAVRELDFHAVPELAAGISISADDASVDGTLQGLMADRVRIESEILARCRDCIVDINGEL